MTVCSCNPGCIPLFPSLLRDGKPPYPMGNECNEKAGAGNDATQPRQSPGTA